MKQLQLAFLLILITQLSIGQVYEAPDGKVGIGTNTPSERLEILGNIGLTGNYGIRLNSTSATNPYNFISFKQLGETKWIIDYGTGQTQNLRFIKFLGANGTTFMNLDYANDEVEFTGGNVGIGTTTPSHKLEVNGTIRSKEVKVEAVPWPDYVFEPNYKLESLESLEKFIQLNGHLPEIPSAQEIEENGLKVGEMNTLLLKKIEELTLYVIEQANQINELKIENEELKNDLLKRIENLENNLK